MQVWLDSDGRVAQNERSGAPAEDNVDFEVGGW
jgi:hypothetical protein